MVGRTDRHLGVGAPGVWRKTDLQSEGQRPREMGTETERRGQRGGQLDTPFSWCLQALGLKEPISPGACSALDAPPRYQARLQSTPEARLQLWPPHRFGSGLLPRTLLS